MTSTAAKMFKFYPTRDTIYGLELFACATLVNIKITEKKRRSNGKPKGYCLRFEKMDDYVILKKVELDDYDKELTSGEKFNVEQDFLSFAISKFYHLLHTFNQSIKQLYLVGPSFFGDLKQFNFNLQYLRKVKDLGLECPIDVAQVLSTITHPLKHLYISQHDTCDNLAHVPEMYQIKGCLDVEFLKLNNSQFLQLTASCARIHVGELNCKNIHQFIKSWQNDEIHHEVKNYQWCHLQEGRLDKKKLFEQFGEIICDFKNERIEVEVKHNKDHNKTAKLVFTRKDFGGGNVQQFLTFIVKPTKTD